jgi:hypothetical protein
MGTIITAIGTRAGGISVFENFCSSQKEKGRALFTVKV